jgi:uncharacterized protein YbbK (DUF523 family)
MSETIKTGISSCLLGRNVRYDGGHKLDHYIRDTLGQFKDSPSSGMMRVKIYNVKGMAERIGGRRQTGDARCSLRYHYVRKYAQPYLSGQSYLNPHPIALQLRNQV